MASPWQMPNSGGDGRKWAAAGVSLLLSRKSSLTSAPQRQTTVTAHFQVSSYCGLPLRKQKAVAVYFSNKQSLLFAFAVHLANQSFNIDTDME